MNIKKTGKQLIIGIILSLLITFIMLIILTSAVYAAPPPPDPSPTPTPIYYDKDQPDRVNFPDYPSAGSINLKKSASWIDKDSTVARVELAVSGVPKPIDTDIVLVVDSSENMNTSITIPNPSFGRTVSIPVIILKDDVEYFSGTTSSATNPITGRVSVSFTAYVDTSTGAIVAANGFMGTISISNSYTNNTDQYLRFESVTYDRGAGTGGTASSSANDNYARNVSAGAKDFYAAVFSGDTFLISGRTLTIPNSLSVLPTSVTANITTTRLAQMKIATYSFIDEIYSPMTFVDANGITQKIPSENRISLVNFGLGNAVQYSSGAFIEPSGSNMMKAYVRGLGTTAGANYVSALDTARSIVTGRGVSGRPIYVVLMSDGEPRGNSNGGGNPVAYADPPGTGDVYNIHNARIALHDALDDTGVDNGVFTVGYMITGIPDAKDWLDSIAKPVGAFVPANNVNDIEDAFVAIAKAAKKAGQNAVVNDFMGKAKNPLETEFDVEVDDASFIVQLGADHVHLVFDDMGGGIYEAEYTIGTRTGTVTVDLSAHPNKIIWDFGNITQEEIVLSYNIHIHIDGDEEEPYGIYYTNDKADITYENYLGILVNREFPIPQLIRLGNSIRVIYFAASGISGNAINADGIVLPLDGGRVNTVTNILRNGIILFDGYLDVYENIILPPPIVDDIVLNERIWDVDAADDYLYMGVPFERINGVGEAYLVYDGDAKTYTQNLVNPCKVELPFASSNGFIVLVGYKPEIKLTIQDKYGYDDPIDRGVPTPLIGDRLGDHEPYGQFEKDRYEFDRVEVTANFHFATYSWSDYIIIDNDEVSGIMPFAYVIITYIYKPDMIDIDGEKIWVDNNDEYGFRSSSVTIGLLRDGIPFGTTTIGPDPDDNSWLFKFPQLIKYDTNDNQIREYDYDIEEEDIDNYISIVVKNPYGIYTVTNTLATTVTVIKFWNDGEDIDRPDEIGFMITGGGETYGPYYAKANEQWVKEVGMLPKYGEGGVEIDYAVSECEVPGYITTILPEPVEGMLAIKNTLMTRVKVIKLWNDNEDEDRPDSIDFMITGGGETYGPYSATAEEQWVKEVSGLPKYDEDKAEIEYAVSECEVQGYITKILPEPVNGMLAIRNTLMTSVKVIKRWNDGLQDDAAKPSIRFSLTGDGNTYGPFTMMGSPWEYIIENLPKYDANDELIVYTVVEEAIPGYEPGVIELLDGGIIKITNTLTPGMTSITVNKMWVDGNNSEDTRPKNGITFTLLKDGVKTNQTRTMTSPKWESVIFDNLVTFDTSDNKFITYSVEESDVEYYKPDKKIKSGSNIIFINTLDQVETSVTVTKVWVDSIYDGNVRPDDVEIVIIGNDGSKFTSETRATRTKENDNTWTYTFNGLLKYNDVNRGLITYTVDENEIKALDLVNYDKMIETINNQNYRITNTLKTYKLTVEYYINDVLNKTINDPVNDALKNFKSVYLSGETYKLNSPYETVTINGVTYNWQKTDGKLSGTFADQDIIIKIYYVSTDGGDNKPNGGGTSTPASTLTPKIEIFEPTPPPKSPAEIIELFTGDHIWYIRGYTDNTIKPNANITRAEISMVFYRLLMPESKNYTPENAFNDVAADDWYGLAINMLKSHDIISGYPNGSFKPNQPITRRELASVVARFQHLLKNNNDLFNDISKDDWAYGYIQSAVKRGWIIGDGNGKFRPDDNLKRSEFVAVANRVFKRHILLDDLLKAFEELEEPEKPDDLKLHKFDDLSESEWSYLDFMEAVYTHEFERKEDKINELWTKVTENGLAKAYNQ